MEKNIRKDSVCAEFDEFFPYIFDGKRLHGRANV